MTQWHLCVTQEEDGMTRKAEDFRSPYNLDVGINTDVEPVRERR